MLVTLIAWKVTCTVLLRLFSVVVVMTTTSTTVAVVVRFAMQLV